MLLIIGLISGLAAPRIGYIPEGILVSQAVSDLNTAFTTAAHRALASGQPIQLRLDFDNSEIVASAVGTKMANAASPADYAATPVSEFFERYSSMPLPDQAELDTNALSHDFNAEHVAYVFFPNGEATGPRVPILIRTRRLTVDVDRLTGRVMIAAVAN